MSRKIGKLLGIFLMLIVLSACGKKTDSFRYDSVELPDYKSLNPVRFEGADTPMGRVGGWQDFGRKGELNTYPQPERSAIYQMYSYYLRNDLKSLYGKIELPKKLAELPAYLGATDKNGSRLLWYSMGRQLPDEIRLDKTQTIAVEGAEMLRAEYTVKAGESTQSWILYLLNENGTYSSFGIRNNGGDRIDFYDQIATSYRSRTGA